MRIAIPVNQDVVAGHFSQAEHFECWDSLKGRFALFDNPALQGNCAGHRQIVEQCVAMGVDAIIVRNIGQRMLDRLLKHSLTVWQLKQRCHLSELTSQLATVDAIAAQMTDASQGRESKRQGHEEQGHQCCHKDGQHSEECQHNHQDGEHGEGCHHGHQDGEHGEGCHHGHQDGEHGEGCHHNHDTTATSSTAKGHHHCCRRGQ
ncbi:NifB/NifX family molybdenum-iron cluster-binding protein [Celerinatantimonas yamalensis]|uniref:NifB/NifX family molybdenum-iron cluster-binding protein n=1 Tax=Celerinatantimonas yamalensis TaxID=559956 RepID=A0ABW9G1I2_9GAMM